MDELPPSLPPLFHLHALKCSAKKVLLSRGISPPPPHLFPLSIPPSEKGGGENLEGLPLPFAALFLEYSPHPPFPPNPRPHPQCQRSKFAFQLCPTPFSPILRPNSFSPVPTKKIVPPSPCNSPAHWPFPPNPPSFLPFKCPFLCRPMCPPPPPFPFLFPIFSPFQLLLHAMPKICSFENQSKMQHQHFSSSPQFCPKFVENSLDNNKKMMGTKKRKESRRKKANGSKGVGIKFGGKKPHQVARRNERERKRVQQVNNGYELLAGTLTKWEAICGDKKLTKAETLKAAILYIRHLENVLHSPQTMNNNNGAMKRESEAVEMIGDDWPQTAMNSPLTTSSPSAECAKNAAEISPNFASQNANFHYSHQISYRPHHQQQGHQHYNNSNNLFQQSAFTFDYI